MSVEGTYRGAKILCAGTCDNGYLTNRMAPSKVDEQIKEIFGEFSTRDNPQGGLRMTQTMKKKNHTKTSGQETN